MQTINAIRNAVRDATAPRPFSAEGTYSASHNFSDFGISDSLRTNIRSLGYDTPTPIQDQAIPLIMQARDVIGIANTGTGKTATFLIPLIEKMARNHSERVLVVTPTRELALQILDDFRSLSRGMGMSFALVIGGSGYGRMMDDLSRGARMVIATPGRLRELIDERGLSLSEFSNVVLDEADRMVDIGFIRDIRYFIMHLPEVRQSLFFSATISGQVGSIIAGFVRNPVTVTVKQAETSRNIRQQLVEIRDGRKKIDHLGEFLASGNYEKVLIFGRTKWGVDKVSRELNKRGFLTDALHGSKRQGQRQAILNRFRTNQIRILLATDVASRGLDIDNVSHVINYDIPESFDDYVHRIGRTGRADKTGTAITYVG